MYANRSTYAQIASARSTIDRDRPERDLSHPGQAERPRKTRDRGVGREKQTSRRHPTGPMRRRRLVASVLVATLGAVGCSSGSPDVNPVDGAPSVTAAATESQVPEAARVSDGSTSAESADGGPRRHGGCSVGADVGFGRIWAASTTTCPPFRIRRSWGSIPMR